MSVINENAAIVEKKLSEKLDIIKTDPDYNLFSTLEQAMRYSLLAGGKRLRPCLAIEFAKLFGGSVEAALDYGCSLEMIHTFSLIHDDMPCMDNDDLRRGKPTNHKVFGEATALLSGDALIAFAFQTLESEKADDRANIEAFKLLAKCTGPQGMCAGQQIDLESEGKKIDISVLEALHSKKTGDLIRCACLLGCIASGKYQDTKEYSDAKEFASCIGLAFQIADDILDVVGDEEKLGKKCGSDEKESKNTYVTLMGIESAKELANKLCAKAKDIISEYPQSGFLCELADYITEREN
jgi:geranylgeranyl diphosphate synthase type II